MKQKSSISSSSLFREPVSYQSLSFHPTKMLVPFTDDDGVSSVKEVCVEDVMSQEIPLNYFDVTLSNLVSKGVDTHSLDMIDTSKIGIDSSIDFLANDIINRASDFVESSNN